MMQFLIAVDQLLNVCLFFLPGGCFADETLSARAWRCREMKPFTFLQPAIDRLFFWQENHCQQAYVSEILRRHSPPESRPHKRRPAA